MPAKDISSYNAHLDRLVSFVEVEQASDLHLNAFYRPVIRVAGVLVPVSGEEQLTHEDTAKFLATMLSDDQRERFDDTHEVDFSYYNKAHKMRFRGHASLQRGAVSIALRYIPSEIKTLPELGIPEQLLEFTKVNQGFFLVVGPVGQGKSTTLAAMMEHINQTRAEHIVTIEDPIEHVYAPKQCIIDQREVGYDTDTFETGLHAAFRQDMDVVLVGEMRGLAAISAAVQAAETGHLVFSTLHTNNASQTINRIVDAFPPHQQNQIRVQLAASLSGIFSQRLVPRISGGLVPAYELLIRTSAIGHLIREGRTHEIDSVIETGTEDGMVSMNRVLANLVREGEITVETAFGTSFDPQALERLL